MASRKQSNDSHVTNGGDSSRAPGERELVVVAGASLRGGPSGVVSSGARGQNADVPDLRETLAAEGATLTPMFRPSDQRSGRAPGGAAAGAAAAGGGRTPDLSQYYRVEAPDEQLDDL